MLKKTGTTNKQQVLRISIHQFQLTPQTNTINVRNDFFNSLIFL